MASGISILLLLAFACCFSRFSAEISRKELRTKETNQEKNKQASHLDQSNTINPSRVSQLSRRPRVFLYQGFLSDEECDHLIFLARGEQEKLGEVDTNKLRTSLDISLKTEDEIVARINERISAWTFLPKVNSESLRVLLSGHEEASRNVDYFGNKSKSMLNTPLMATVVLYLSNVTQGGQILFPGSEPNKTRSDCSKTTTTTTTKPTKGNAILLFHIHPNASSDKTSVHARCPLLNGQMWWATKLFYVKKPYIEKNNTFEIQTDVVGECTDEDENCPIWAANGECKRNYVFMVGSPDYYGTCRRSCNVC